MTEIKLSPQTVCADFDVDCAHGDPITEGQTVVLVHGAWFHLDCFTNGTC